MSPSIKTERLYIRPLAESDLDAMHAVFSDPAVMTYIPAGARDRAGSAERLGSLIEHQRRHGFSKWAVVQADAGQVLGDCGLQYLDGGTDIELGFHLARAHWGHGYAREAAQACLEWALRERRERVVAIVDPANARSIRVLESIGMQPTGSATYFGRDWTLYLASVATLDNPEDPRRVA